MSLRAMVWVLYESRAGSAECPPADQPTDRLVLLAIADDAADDGTGAFPSHDTIARKAMCHRATAIRSIERLERAGELLVKRPETRGRGRHNEYTMVMGRDPGAVAAAVGWPLPGLDGGAVETSHGATIPDTVDSPPAPPVSQTGNGPETSQTGPGNVAPVRHDPFTRRPLGRKRVSSDDPAAAGEHIAAQRALAERNAERAAADIEPPADLAQARAAAAAARAALRTPALPAAELEAGDELEEPTA